MTTETTQTPEQLAALAAQQAATAATTKANEDAASSAAALVGKPVVDSNGNQEVNADGTLKFHQAITPPKETAADSAAQEFDPKTAKTIQPLIEAAGLVPADIAKDMMASNGKVSETVVKALTDKHGEAIANLIVDGLQNMHTSTASRVAAEDKVVFDQVAKAFEGSTNQTGEESWKELVTWTKGHLTADEAKELNGMLRQGGLSRKLAVDAMIDTFQASSSFTQSAVLVQGDNFANNVLPALDRAGYDRELRTLLEKGHDYDRSPEIATLNRRRLNSINRGK